MTRRTWLAALMTMTATLALTVGLAAAQETQPEMQYSPAVSPSVEGQPADQAKPAAENATPAAQPNGEIKPADGQQPTDPGQPGGEQVPPKEAPKSPFSGTMLWVFLGLMVLLMVFMGRKPRKEEQKRKEMLANLKKGDKITTIGGINGTIMDVREDEIVVKVDETSNTKMKFARWAIRGLGEDKTEAEKK